MDFFNYRDGRLFAEETDLATLAARVGTPTYIYSKATLALHYDRIAHAFAPLSPLICFAVKSCSNLSVLRVLAERGSAMDVVSGGELHRARLAGVPHSRIVFAGVGKTEAEIRDALGGAALRAAPPPAGAPHPGVSTPLCPDPDPIALFNIESAPEFQTIAAIAKSLNIPCRAALRINPDVDPHTHAYTATGKAQSKFGVDLDRARDFFDRYARHSHLKLTGLHLHIGSPVADTAPYVQAVTKALALIDNLAAHGHPIDTLDLGGGFAADYETGLSPVAADYAAPIIPLLKDRVSRGLRLILEPGRTISANAGVLLTRVQYVKQSGPRKFAVCDAGMHTLIRPALYGSFHFIWPVAVAPQHQPPRRAARLDLPGLETCDVVGPICESGDFLAQDRPLPPLARGDLLAVFGAGAYGMVMASHYNSHPLPAEVLIDGRRATLIRARESYDDLTAHELAPTDVSI